MSFEEKLKSHAVHGTLKTLKEIIENYIAKNETEQPEDIKRLLAAVIYTEARLNNLDPFLAPISHFNTLNKHLIGITNELNNFIGNHDLNQLAAASNRADVLITQLEQLPKGKDTGIDDQSFAINFSETFENILRKLIAKKSETVAEFLNLQNQIKAFENELIKHSNIIEKQKSRLDTAIAEFQKQFSDSEHKRSESFQKSLNDSNKEFSVYLEKNKNDIQKLLLDKRNEIDNTIDEIKHLAGANIDQANLKAEKLFQSHESKAEETIRYLEDVKLQAGKLLNIISNIGVTGNYKEIANSERTTANWLRGFAVVFMLVSIGVIADFVFKLTKDGVDWKILLLRLGITLIIFIPAFYLAKESGLHRRNEVRDRKMELELASFNPFLELLPEKERVEVKVKMADRFFAQPDPTLDDKAYVKADNIFGLLKEITVNLSKCFKK